MGSVPADVSVPYFDIVRKDLSLFGGFMYDLSASRAVMRMLETGLIDMRHYTSKAFEGIESIEQALDYAGEHQSTRFGVFVHP